MHCRMCCTEYSKALECCACVGRGLQAADGVALCKRCMALSKRACILLARACARAHTHDVHTNILLRA